MSSQEHGRQLNYGIGEGERMMAEILENMKFLLVALIMTGIIMFGYYSSYNAYKEYKSELCEEITEHTTLFFPVMYIASSCCGVLVYLLILVNCTGW